MNPPLTRSLPSRQHPLTPLRIHPVTTTPLHPSFLPKSIPRQHPAPSTAGACYLNESGQERQGRAGGKGRLGGSVGAGRETGGTRLEVEQEGREVKEVDTRWEGIPDGHDKRLTELSCKSSVVFRASGLMGVSSDASRRRGIFS
eukprot:1027316-Rhodomonas_salina.1